ncbi:MAG TPA: ComEC/Rec2 family competence protein [Parcubacteria group bacterium]|jgi:competence protein ComEC|nr:ComEC/Rec2 family competence protein [Parcubacteria group bacterium]
MILSATFGFISGIALASFVHITTVYFYTLSFVVLLCFIYRYFVEGEDRKRLTMFTVFFLFVLVGVLRVNISNLYSQSKLSEFENKKVQIVGAVVSEPDVREKNTKLTIETEIVDGNKIKEKILISVPLYPEFQYGDKVSGVVSLQKPKEIESEDGRVFDYGGYLRVRGIWYTSSYTSLTLLSSGNGNSIKTLLFKTKKLFTNSIQKVLPEPESSLLGGLLLGSKQSLGKELLTEFQRTGVSHIVVLSGYNIAIVSESIINFLKFLPKNVSFGFGVLGIILFTMLAGSGASGVRASIMVLVALLAKHFNREYKASRVLGFTIILMLAPNPLLLVFDPSFQLSILATIGIVYVSPIVETYFEGVTNKWGIRETLSTTVATQITVLPFLVFNTGLLSLVSLPVNVLILGTIPITMFLGFTTGLLGLINFYLSVIPGFFTYWLLWYQLKVVHLGSSISFGAINLPLFNPVIVIFIYAFIFTVLYKLRKV